MLSVPLSGTTRCRVLNVRPGRTAVRRRRSRCSRTIAALLAGIVEGPLTAEVEAAA
jgi:hypothetical protein